MNYLKISILSITVILSLKGNAQKPWSLTDCIEYAHANNIQIKRAELQASAAKGDYFQSKMNLLPDLNAGFRRGYIWGQTIDPNTSDFSASDSISWSDGYSIQTNVILFNGLQNYHYIKATEYQMLSQIQNVEKEKVEITLSISTAYLNILFAKELLEVNKRQQEVTKQQVDRTQKLVEAGSVAKGSLLEIKAQLANENLNVTNAQNDLNVAYLNLAQILDLDSLKGFEIIFPDTIDPLINAAIISPNTVYSEALLFLPHIKSTDYQVKAAENNLNIQRGRLLPQVSAFGGWSTRYSTLSEDNLGLNYGDQLNGFAQKTIGISLSVPIFNRWYTKNQIDRAKINLEDAKFAQDQIHQELYKQIQQSYNDAVSAGEKYIAAQEAVISNQEAFEYTKQKYDAGIVTTVEYNIAKTNFTKAESDFAQAKYQYVFAIKILDFYRGVPMAL